MPVLKIKENGVWKPISGISEHTHTKDDIVDLQSSLNDIYYTKNEIDSMEFITVNDIDEICGQTLS